GLLAANKNDNPDDDIYFNFVVLMDEDAFRDYDAYTLYVYRTIKQIEKEYDNIELVSVNSTKDPDYVKTHYMRTTSDTPGITDVIIEIADKDHNSRSDLGYKKYSIRSFYTIDTDKNEVIGYNAETKILSAIAQLTGKVGEDTAPVVYYLQGHGEPVLADAADWKGVFEDAGYSVKEINLLSEDFPEKITKGSLVFINLPKSDLYSDEDGGVSEVKKLRRFAATQYGNVILTIDSSVSGLPALDSLMSEWGIGIGGTITDNEHSVSGSGAVKVLADYSQTESGTLTDIVSKITGSGSQTPTIFTSPRAVYVYDRSSVVIPANGQANTAALLLPYKSAKIDGDVPSGASAALASVTAIIGDVNADAETTHYVFCIGSSDFVNKNYDNSNANKTLVYYILDRMWSGNMTFENIKYKAFDDNSLSVTTAQTNAWTIACVGVIPVAFVIAGTVVWIRRRHS
ncbi:MAG: hypothetical protein ACI4QR_06515, partial [Eubacteriales bacterium]